MFEKSQKRGSGCYVWVKGRITIPRSACNHYHMSNCEEIASYPSNVLLIRHQIIDNSNCKGFNVEKIKTKKKQNKNICLNYLTSCNTVT